ncbi:SPOR domain-containing protein [Yersinia hibernica]|uniref:Cell division protein DamX n=1 Tax=Yersinia enterocolitica LC20 TaxID=1443113 RepID=A0A7U4JZR7_YEREN|nr:SPOR domain-containing protein [Yersinia hibernica]AHM71535.1 SPOR domain-containing protein [Yersinia hibernica]OVZ91982.1 SPOR domain-containing protein [Yersinia kristensenii]
MDDLKPEDDLKPDSSDRRPTRARKSSTGPKLAVSRQHMMIGIGILVLLLIIIAIGSALKAPTEHEASQQNPNVDARSINLSDSSSLTSGNNTQPAVANNTTDGHDANGVKNTAQPQDISVPPISPTPTEAAPQSSANGPTQRVELPGNMSDALSQTQGQVDTLSQNMNDGQTSTLPTAPATVSGSKGAKAPAAREPLTHPAQKSATTATKQPAVSHKSPTTAVSPAASAVAKSGTTGSSALKNAPGSHFTLQLSSASRSDTLNAYAKQQKLSDYHVYETKRDGKPWYILVSGNYASSADAKRAIATLPADVQAKKPWVKPVQQVQQDLKK